MKTRITLAALLVAGLTTHCDQPEPDGALANERVAEITENLLAAGYTPEDIEVRTPEGPVPGQEFDGEPMVIVEGDLHVTLEASRELADAAADGGDGFRLWRTPNLVNNDQHICLVPITSDNGAHGDAVLSSDMYHGVLRARDNYNDLNIGLDFSVREAFSFTETDSYGYTSWTLQADYSGCAASITIWRQNGNSSGLAGFPAGGMPYGLVTLYSGLDSGWGRDVLEHVVTHEVGHCLGLRHADWKTRTSCGQNVSESKDGAQKIPGTADQTQNSVMKACFGSSEDGEFHGEDQTAIETLY